MHNMKYLKVEGNPDLCRDTKSKAVVNTNTSAYTAYMNRMNKLKDDEERKENVDRSLSELRSDIDEIKSLLVELIKNK